MATKKLTEKQLYKAKVEWFQENEYEEVEPVAFYREIFPVGSFQDKGNTERKAGNGIGRKARSRPQPVHSARPEVPAWRQSMYDAT